MGPTNIVKPRLEVPPLSAIVTLPSSSQHQCFWLSAPVLCVGVSHELDGTDHHGETGDPSENVEDKGVLEPYRRDVPVPRAVPPRLHELEGADNDPGSTPKGQQHPGEEKEDSHFCCLRTC